MATKTERVTRFDNDIVEAAATEGARQSRSARQQLDYWVRLGRAVSAQTEAPLNRVRLALDGRLHQRELTVDEARQFDAETHVRISQAAASADFSNAAVPDFAHVTPDPFQLIARGGATDGASRRDLLEQLDGLRALLATDADTAEAGRAAVR